MWDVSGSTAIEVSLQTQASNQDDWQFLGPNRFDQDQFFAREAINQFRV